MLKDLDSAKDITEQVTRILVLAEAGERLPTPVDDIIEAAGLSKSDEIVVSESMIRRAPASMRRLLRSAGRKISGVLDRRERVIQVADISTTGRKRFVACHEVAHDIFQWQSDLAVLGDNHLTLSPQVTSLFEREANQGAAEILFQQDLLKRIARDYPVEIATPVELAKLFGASIHATFRRWVEEIDAPVCGLVLDTEISNGRRKRYEQVTSSEWRERFGPKVFPGSMSKESYPFVSALEINGTLPMKNSDEETELVQYETLETPYRRFVLLWLPTTRSLIARRRRRATIVS
ncbi:MAG: ImmA/IrrE family metallo-endopeptidase [bacterium]|nr:ImmA/IrrE family metallo-endopeptidase [bacterium]